IIPRPLGESGVPYAVSMLVRALGLPLIYSWGRPPLLEAPSWAKHLPLLGEQKGTPTARRIVRLPRDEHRAFIEVPMTDRPSLALPVPRRTAPRRRGSWWSRTASDDVILEGT